MMKKSSHDFYMNLERARRKKEVTEWKDACWRAQQAANAYAEVNGAWEEYQYGRNFYTAEEQASELEDIKKLTAKAKALQEIA